MRLIRAGSAYASRNDMKIKENKGNEMFSTLCLSSRNTELDCLHRQLLRDSKKSTSVFEIREKIFLIPGLKLTLRSCYLDNLSIKSVQYPIKLNGIQDFLGPNFGPPYLHPHACHREKLDGLSGGAPSLLHEEKIKSDDSL